jgi:hypothetical protein
MATPCSVKAWGSLRVPPQLDVPFWKIKALNPRPKLLKKLAFPSIFSYLRLRMSYARITIHLKGGGIRSGIRHFDDPMNLQDIRAHALQLAAESLGRGSIEQVTVEEVPASDPAVVALILKDKVRKNMGVAPSDGKHPYLKQQLRKPPR